MRATEDFVEERKEREGKKEPSGGRLGEGRTPGSNSVVYIGDLSYLTTEADLCQLFSTVGQIASLNIIKGDAVAGRNRCYAYVTFFDPSSVPLAIEKFNFCELHSSQIRIMPCDKSLVKNKGEANIMIKGLPRETDNQVLHDTFSIFGHIVSCKVQQNSHGECTGVGFIQFEDVEKANKALLMINKITMKGKKLVANKCIPSEMRVSKKCEINNVFTNVYIKNFSPKVSEEALRSVFEEVGPLTSFFFPLQTSGMPKGFAFANFATHGDAVKAIETLHGSTVLQERGYTELKEALYVQRAQLKTEREEELSAKFAGFAGDISGAKRNLYVTNLPHGIREEEVLQFFSNFGGVISVKVDSDEKKEVPRSYACVCYSTAEEAENALERTQNAEIDGHKLQVTFFKNKRQREMEKISNLYSYIPYPSYGSWNSGKEKPKQKEVPTDITDLGIELYNLILSLAPNYTEKIKQAGFETDEDFASKITGVLLDMGREEIKKAIGLGNVLSQYVEGTLDEIISHREEE